MQLDPPEPTLVTLERGAVRVVGQNWQKALDQVFVDNLGKHRKYVVQSVRDLLRAMRNKASPFRVLCIRDSFLIVLLAQRNHYQGGLITPFLEY